MRIDYSGVPTETLRYWLYLLKVTADRRFQSVATDIQAELKRR